eukprot:scaffold193022_cov50-Tisochrysis_lutea.AAC.1
MDHPNGVDLTMHHAGMRVMHPFLILDLLLPVHHIWPLLPRWPLITLTSRAEQQQQCRSVSAQKISTVSCRALNAYIRIELSSNAVWTPVVAIVHSAGLG